MRIGPSILKLGHHGSDHSTTAAWLRAVQPRVAVASCGLDNRFGHPGQNTLARLRAAGVHLFRTDHDGAVAVTLEPGGMRVSTYLSRRTEWIRTH